MQKVYKFYLLRSNKSVDDIRYIGVTSRSLKQRFYTHKNASKSKELPVYNWWRKREKEGFNIFMELIDSCVSNWEYFEKYWIRHYRQMGFKLLNVSTGGSGIVTAEQRTLSSRLRSIKGHQKAIIALSLNGDFIREFNSIQEASEIFNVSKTSLGNVLHNRSKSAGGYRWIFKSNKDAPIDIYSRNKSKPVYQFDLNGNLQKTYWAIREFERLKGYSANGINSAISRKTVYHNAYWSFSSEIDVTQYARPYKYIEINNFNNIVNYFKTQQEVFSKFNLFFKKGKEILKNGILPNGNKIIEC